MKAPRTTLALLLLAALPAASRAATVLVVQETTQGPAAATVVRRVTLDAGRVRLDPIGGGQLRTVIFRPDTGTLWVLDDAAKTYLELNRSETPFGTDTTGAAARAIDARQDLTEAQKQQLKEMLKTAPGGRTGPAASDAEKTTYKKVDSGFIVDGFHTDKYEATLGGRKVADLWVTDLAAASVPATDLAGLRKLATLFADPTGRGPGVRLDLGGEVPGLPIRVLRYEDGKLAAQTDVTAVRQEEVPAASFDLPAGYKKQGEGLASGG